MRTSPPSDRSARRFAYRGVTVAVRAEPSALAWLEEFLVPAFDVDDVGPADCVVRLEADPARYAEILRRGPRPDGARVAAFVLDNRVAACSAWTAEGDGWSVRDDALGAFYEIGESGTRVEVVTERPSLASRVAVMRAVRELTLSRLRLQDGLLLHGAAVASFGRGVVVAGPKEAGKTTLALHALRAPGACFVANDRVWVDLGEAPARVQCVPTIVAIRPSTLDYFPATRERLGAVGSIHALTVAEARTVARRARGRGASVTAAQLCDALGVRVVAGAQLASVVFPRVTDGTGGITIEPLSSIAAARRLAESLFHAAAPSEVSEAFPPPAGARVPDLVALHRRCATLAARVPCYEARLGRDAYRDPTSNEALVRGLAADAAAAPRA